MKSTFKSHIDELSIKASYKLHVLRGECFYCPFLYAPVIWMFATESSVNKIFKIQFKTLQVVYHGHDKHCVKSVLIRSYYGPHFPAFGLNTNYAVKSCEKLLAATNDISVHQNHFRTLVIEVHKSFMETNPDFLWDFYTIKPVLYDLHDGEKLYIQS